MKRRLRTPDLGARLVQARREQGLTQAQLATRSRLNQAQIAYFETGERSPSLEHLLRLAGSLDLPLQYFLTGTTQPGTRILELAIQLRHLGVVDLFVPSAPVPAAFRPAEEVVSLVLAEDAPDPRILEAVPAVLAWNRWRPLLFFAFAKANGRTAVWRLGWLAEAVLALDRGRGFPGGCVGSRSLGKLVKLLRKVRGPIREEWDDLGRGSESPPASPIWKRWRVRYPADLNDFRARAETLLSLREGSSRESVHGT